MLVRTIRVPFAAALLALFCISMLAQDAPAPRPRNVVPQGTTFAIQLSDQLDTNVVKRGDSFLARLAEPLVTTDGQTVDAGKKIKGHVTAVEPGFHTRMILSIR